jgi:hypothetical protein
MIIDMVKELNYANVVSCGIIQNTDGRGMSLLRPRRDRPRSRAAEQRDERAPFQWPMSPLLPPEDIAHLGGAGDLLHCGISNRLMVANGSCTTEAG